MCIQFLPLLAGALGLGASLLAPKPKMPPAPEVPATSADAAREAGATVRVGAGKDDDTSDVFGVSTTTTPETRIFGKPVGGLGKAGLSI